jgi:tRNA-(ms[2]io[6]A)-hydroxylase
VTTVLTLKVPTERRWLAQVDTDLPAILIDHAHCEKKAAGTAMNLIFAYGSVSADMARELSEIVIEEMEHFRLVLDLLGRRGIRFTSQPPGGYGRKLNDLVRKGEPQRAVDRMLIASLIEARSCERFSLLRDHVADRELAEFYGSLFESEARHHSTYVRLATQFAPESEVRTRLQELADDEARIIGAGDPLPRMHS